MSLKFTDIPWLEHRKFGQQGIWIDGTEDEMTFSTASLSQVSQIYRKALSMKQTYDLSVKESALNDEYPEESFVDLVRENQTVDRDSICGHWFNLEIREVKRIADAYVEQQAGELKEEYDALQRGYAAVVKVADEKVRWYEKYNQELKASNETLRVKNRMLTEDADYWKDLAEQNSNRIQEITQEVSDSYKVKYELQDKVKELEAQIQDLKCKLQDAQETCDDLAEACKNKCNRIDELLDQNDSLLKQNDNISKENSDLRSENYQLAKEGRTLLDKKIELEYIIDGLKDSYKRDTKRITEVLGQNESLMDQNENLRQQITELQSKQDSSGIEDRIARQQTLIMTLQASLDKERRFNDCLTSDYNELKKQNENLKKTLGIKIESWNS